MGITEALKSDGEELGCSAQPLFSVEAGPFFEAQSDDVM